MAENFSGPYSREIEYLDKIADILLGPDDLVHNVGDRRTFALQRMMEFFIQEGSGRYRNVQADWNADPDSEAAILNKPDGIPVDPDYVHTEENFTTEHRNKLENIEHFAQHNVQADWTEENPESDAYIKNVPDDIVQDGDYVHTDFNFNEHYKDMLDYHVITDDYYTPEDSEKLAGIEWNATHTDIDDEITPDSTNPVESGVIFNWMETKVDKEDGYALSKNDFTDELKAKLDAIEEEANKIIVDSELDNTSTNPVENQVVCAALDTKVDKAEDQSLMTRVEHLKLEGIEEQANRTIPDENITANSHNVVESRAIYEALDTKVNKINGKGLSENDFTDAYKNKLDNIDDYADNTIVDAQVTEASMNPVTSNAIYTELEKKVDKEEGKSLFTDEERIKLGKFDPDAPKVTIVDIVLNGSSGKYDMLSLTWQQCKDAISNGILYCKDSLGDVQAVSFCYSVETEDRDEEPVYRVEFASFNNEYYAFFEAEAPNKRPVFVGSENVKPDLSGKVDKTTKVNGHALDTDVSITPNDIDHSFNRAYDNGTIGASLKWLRDYKADKGTQINGHSLESDVTLTPNDIEYDPEADYLDGSIGEHVKSVDNNVAELNITFGEVSEGLANSKVDKTTTVNGHALDQNVIVAAGDVPYSSSENYKGETVGKALKDQAAAYESLDQRKADKTTTVNGHPLGENVVITPSDIAYSEDTAYSNGSIGKKISEIASEAGNLGEDKVDKTTTVNGQSLSGNVVLGSGDIAYDPEESYAGGSIGEKVTELNQAKVDKVPGKGLSANDFTNEYKEKVDGVEVGAQVNAIEKIVINGTRQAINDKTVSFAIPTKTSDIENDSDFVTHNILSAVNPIVNGTASPGTSEKASREDHVHPTDTTRAPIDSPTFNGVPKAATAAKGTNSTQLATTAFVQTAIEDKANASDVYTKQQVDNKITAVYRLKGSKPDADHLPTDGNETGDVWHVNSDGSEYFWNGETWEFFGESIDLTGYVYDPNYSHIDNNFTDAFKAKLIGIEDGANKTTVDSELSSSSPNPVENRAVTAAIEVKVDKETGKGLSTNDYTTEEKTKLAYIEAEANKTIVDTQLSEDSTNPIENRAVKHGLDEKVDKVPGMALSHNDFTDSYKAKLDGVEAGGQVNVIESISVNGTRQAVNDKSVNIVVPTKVSDLSNDQEFLSRSEFHAATPAMDGIGTPGVSNTVARGDHVHPTDTSRAPIDSPAFSGTPKAPTAAKGTSTTQIASTAFVQNAIADKANADDVYTKQQIDTKLTAVYRLKGVQPDVAHLPQLENEVGDVWHVSSDDSEYFWNGEEWEFLGKIVDLTGYVYDTDYVHTDNNFTNALKSKIDVLGENDVVATEDYVDNAVSERALANNVYTKTEVDNKLVIVFRYNGVKEHISDLHYNANEIGDVWTVDSESWDFYWTGTEWKRVGGHADFTGYAYDPHYVHTDENFTSELKDKLVDITTGSLVNVQSDWAASGGEEEILNKPLINNVELVSGNNTLQSLGIDIATEQSIDDLFN